MARPTKNPTERLRPVTIHLDEPSVELLDHHSRARGVSRGGLVAAMLRWLNATDSRGTQ